MGIRICFSDAQVHSWHQSRLVDGETEALGIKIVNQGLGGAQLGANWGVQGYVLS